MSAIPGERRITEINVPYAHDSATKLIDSESVLVDIDYVGDIVADILKDFGWKYAQTQLLTVPEQLNSGVRVLDVRMNNVGPEQSSIYWTGFEDDGENLWVAHGRKATGTYYAKNEDGTTVSVAQVLGNVKQFLTDHLQELADETNPSTGKPYLYREEGRNFFDRYIHLPKLKDCRGLPCPRAALSEQQREHRCGKQRRHDHRERTRRMRHLCLRA